MGCASSNIPPNAENPTIRLAVLKKAALFDHCDNCKISLAYRREKKTPLALLQPQIAPHPIASTAKRGLKSRVDEWASLVRFSAEK